MAADILAYLNQKEFPTCRTRASSRVSPRETAQLPPLLLETIPRTPLPGPLIRLSVSLTVTPSQPWSDLLTPVQHAQLRVSRGCDGCPSGVGMPGGSDTELAARSRNTADTGRGSVYVLHAFFHGGRETAPSSNSPT